LALGEEFVPVFHHLQKKRDTLNFFSQKKILEELARRGFSLLYAQTRL
jgi:hypothetical protein